MPSPTPSATTRASNAFVAAHLAHASAVGAALGELVMQPDACVGALSDGLASIADPVYVDGVKSVTPGLDRVLGVRLPLLSAVHRSFKRGTRRTPTSVQLDVYERLCREEVAELRWFAIWNLERVLPTDPERTWQLLRRFAREAHEWITVDTLGHPYGAGILLDARRWAELEQLVYSPSRWERRLVGSTLAEMPFQRGVPGARAPQIASRGLDLIAQLLGDDEPDVQKALSWALRSLVLVDSAAVQRFIENEADLTVETDDGHRAWVLRDSLSKLPPEAAHRLRGRLTGIRKRPGTPSTSTAARIAAEFLPGLPGSPVEATIARSSAQ